MTRVRHRGDRLYETTDGAGSWQAVTPNIRLDGVTQLDFVSAGTGWAAAGGSLVKATDGGRTWIQPPFTAGNEAFSSYPGVSGTTSCGWQLLFESLCDSRETRATGGGSPVFLLCLL